MIRVRTVRRTRSSAGSGFTLVELLVVVSIIALLIAILLPSLRKARDQSKDVVCKANMHSMGQAFTMYAEKYNGVWPAYMDSMGSQNRWPVPFHEGKIVNAELNTYDDSGGIVRRGGPSIFLCPAEKVDRTILSWVNKTYPAGHPVDRVEVGGSYAYSMEIHRNGDTLELGSSSPPVAPFHKKVDNCRRPGEVFSVLENRNPIEKTSSPGWCFCRGDTGDPTVVDGRAFFFAYRSIDGTPFPSNPTYEARKVIGGRHAGRTNALAIDTHVEAQRPERIRYDQVSWTRWPGPSLPPGGL